MSWRSKRVEVVSEEAPAPQGDDAALAEKLAELTHREVALRRITEAVEKQRTGLEQRERALASSASAAAAGEERLAEAIRRAEESEQRVRELEQHVSELEARPAPQAEPAAPVEAIEEPLAPAPRPRVLDLDGEPTYTLQRLERLVHEAELRGDSQAEEWAYYLPLLREQAEPDGRLPAQFASLVDSIFDH
jgi:alkylhydroperoxidase/carboxymuconolactone decarboxylase family protein YurZ